MVDPVLLIAGSVGAAGIAALYALHYLRIQPQSKRVATVIFWQSSTRQQISRSLWARRFKHPRTFSLLSVIALLFTVSLISDRWKRHNPVHVVIVDNGDSMGATDSQGVSRVDRAVKLAASDTDGRTENSFLIATAEQPAVLARPGDPRAAFDEQLHSIRPSSSASGPALAINLAISLISSENGTIDWYTDQSNVPEGVSPAAIRKINVHSVSDSSNAVSITDVTFNNNTLSVLLNGTADAPVTVSVSTAKTEQAQTINKVESAAEADFAKMPTDGSLATVSLTNAPGSPAEHVATYRLPLRFPLRFCFLTEAPSPLRDALLTIGTETSTSAGCIAVVAQGQTAPAGASSIIELVTEGSKNSGPAILKPAEDSSIVRNLNFEGASVVQAAAVPGNLTPLLNADSQIVAGLSSDQRRLYLSKAILTPDSALSRAAAFPIFLSRACEVLAGFKPESDTATSLRVLNDPLWTPAGAPNVVHAVPLLAAAILPDSKGVVTVRTSNWSQWTIGTALLLLTTETLLFLSRKIV